MLKVYIDDGNVGVEPVYVLARLIHQRLVERLASVA